MISISLEMLKIVSFSDRVSLRDAQPSRCNEHYLHPALVDDLFQRLVDAGLPAAAFGLEMGQHLGA